MPTGKSHLATARHGRIGNEESRSVEDRQMVARSRPDRQLKSRVPERQRDRGASRGVPRTVTTLDGTRCHSVRTAIVAEARLGPKTRKATRSVRRETNIGGRDVNRRVVGSSTTASTCRSGSTACPTRPITTHHAALDRAKGDSASQGLRPFKSVRRISTAGLTPARPPLLRFRLKYTAVGLP